MAAEAPKIPHTPLTFPLLPPEMRLLIITEAAQHSPRGHLAAVSKEWQLLIEKKTFASLVVDKDQLFFLGEYVTGKRERLVKRICLNVKLSPYNCRYCLGERDWDYHFSSDRIFNSSLIELFWQLRWWREGSLTLEINAYSPSDSDHFFKGYYVGDPAEDEAFGDPRTFDDQAHGFSPTGQEAPQERDTREVYALMTRSIHYVHPVRVVKRLLIRRQCRRQLATNFLSLLFAALPALKHIHYEPWRMSDEEFQDAEWYPGFSTVISGMYRQIPRSLKTLILFEDFNQVFFPDAPASTRIPNVQFAQALVNASLKLQHLSASFMVDAQDFFNASQAVDRRPKWKNLEFLALTSLLVDPEDKDLGLTNLLEEAGRFALGTPRLRTMILWYGNKNKAYAFIYKRDETSITWHGTREFYINQQCITEI